MYSLSDFDYNLPEELIATSPAEPRDSSRMLVYDGNIKDDIAKNFLSYLKPNDLVIFNDTKVINSQLTGIRIRGNAAAKLQVNLSKKIALFEWECFIKPLKKVKSGDILKFSDDFEAKIISKTNELAVVKFNVATDAEFFEKLHQTGNMPLPPYITSRLKKRDKDYEERKYQTVFAKNKGAVAAPTASLHFTKDMMDSIENKAFVTLHVGAGTFLPVKEEDISQHRMHSEWGEISDEVAVKINETRASGGKIFAIGTTALRILESAVNDEGAVSSFCGDTDIFITPPYDFKVVDVLMTNFHLPKSTLIMLISAFVDGVDNAFRIYNYAIENKYRFYSFGDTSLLFRKSHHIA